MVKEKKINIRYFLNKSIKSSFINGVEVHPVYYQVTYNRKNNKFPFYLLNAVGGISEERFEKLFISKSDLEFNEMLKRHEDDLIFAIRYEHKTFQENFTMKGLPERMDLYERNFMREIEEFVYDEFKVFASQHLESSDLNYFFSELRFFSQTYYLVNEKIDNLKESLPYELVIYITVYVHLSAFFSATRDNLDDNQIKIKDWLKGKFKAQFSDYIRNVDSYTPFKNEAKFSPILHLLSDFPIHPNFEIKYFKAIELIVNDLLYK